MIMSVLNHMESGKLRITTPELKIAVSPEYSHMIGARVIDGRPCLAFVHLVHFAYGICRQRLLKYRHDARRILNIPPCLCRKL